MHWDWSSFCLGFICTVIGHFKGLWRGLILALLFLILKQLGAH